MLATAYGDKLTIRDETTGKVRVTGQISGQQSGCPIPMTYSTDGRWLALGTRDGHIVLFDGKTGVERKRFMAVEPTPLGRIFSERGSNYVTALSFSPDGRWIFSCGTDLQLRLWEVETAIQFRTFKGHESAPAEVAISKDARTAFSSAEDGQSFLWELRPDTAKLTPQQQWDVLASDNPDLVYRTIWTLSENPQDAILLLRSKMHAIAIPDPLRLQKLTIDLDSDDFRVREEAFRELLKHGDAAEPALKNAMKKPKSLETRRRLERLLDELKRDLSPNDLREFRAIQSLELAGTQEARALLRDWAGGAPAARFTRDARAALGRAEQRANAPAMR
jgi:WD40 repeat protein